MSINYDLIRELKEWTKEYVKGKIAAGIVKYGSYARSTASGEHDKISGYQTEGSDEEPYDFEGRRVFPFGIRSLPPSGTWGVWVGKGGRSGDGIIVGAESSRFGPSDLQDGETAIYNKVSGTVIKLDKDGNISITPGAGKKVQVGAATAVDAAVLGSTFYSALQTFLGALNTFVTAVVTPTGVPTLAVKTAMLNAIAALEAVDFRSTVVTIK